MTRTLEYFVGLDLGPAHEHTGLAVLGQQGCGIETGYAVRHLHRWPPATPYTAIAAELDQWLALPELRGCPLVLDQTAVGRAVVELFQSVTTAPRRVVITAGQAVQSSPEGHTMVTKKELVGILQVLLQGRRLKIAAGLPLAEMLTSELAAFRAKVTTTVDDTESMDWRHREHDDLVLAIALAAWQGERPSRSDPGEPVVLSPGWRRTW